MFRHDLSWVNMFIFFVHFNGMCHVIHCSIILLEIQWFIFPTQWWHLHPLLCKLNSPLSGRKFWLWFWCCCCLNWPVMLTACWSAADNPLAPVASMCCCAAPAARPWGDRSQGMQPLAYSLWVNGKERRIVCRVDSTSSSMGPGTKPRGSWLWGRGLNGELWTSTWTW